MPLPRIHHPTLYEWEFNSAIHNRYDYGKLQPTPDASYKRFLILGTLSTLVALSSGLLLISMMRSKRVRNNIFNWYLFFVILPDFIMGVGCAWTCFSSAPLHHYSSEWMCGFQSFYLNFSIMANLWMNAVICWQILRMLRYSHQRRRYQPPTRQQVLKHTGCVYGYCLFWALLSSVGNYFGNHFPHSTHLYYGFVCMPMEFDIPSTIFFFCVYFFFGFFLPPNYINYTLMEIYKHKLLPPVGRRRKLSLFLLRLVTIFLLIWTPWMIVTLVGHFVPMKSIWAWLAACMAHFQGIITVAFCLAYNEDIRKSSLQLSQCRWRESPNNGEYCEPKDPAERRPNLSSNTAPNDANEEGNAVANNVGSSSFFFFSKRGFDFASVRSFRQNRQRQANNNDGGANNSNNYQPRLPFGESDDDDDDDDIMLSFAESEEEADNNDQEDPQDEEAALSPPMAVVTEEKEQDSSLQIESISSTTATAASGAFHIPYDKSNEKNAISSLTSDRDESKVEIGDPEKI